MCTDWGCVNACISYCWNFDVGQTVCLVGTAAQCLSLLALFFVLHGNFISMPLCYLCLCLFDSHLRDSNRNCLGNISKFIQESGLFL